MVGKLQAEIQQHKPFTSVETEAFLNILRTADGLTRDLETMLKPYGLTSTQYNLLRILRGVGDGGATCSAIGERMIKRDPDVTRLLDRMQKRGLLRRSRQAKDRRLVTAAITLKGRRLADDLDAPVDAFHRHRLQALSQHKLAELINDMERIRNQHAVAALP
jgi:DNA-binding MarR family transcriptional regulator